MTEQLVAIKIVETTNYYREVPLATLEQVAKVTLGECNGDLELLLECVRAADDPGLQDYLERHGDVAGQEWSAEWVDYTTVAVELNQDSPLVGPTEGES